MPIACGKRINPAKDHGRHEVSIGGNSDSICILEFPSVQAEKPDIAPNEGPCGGYRSLAIPIGMCKPGFYSCFFVHTCASLGLETAGSS